MKIQYFLLIILSFITSFVYAQTNKLSPKEKQVVEDLIKTIKTKDAGKIADVISYPLRREYPLPDIKDKKDFRERFKQIFDKKFIHIITHSKIKDWSKVGWRGIMLNYGILWIDEDGKITGINYQSVKEKKLLKKAIKKDKKSLPVSLRHFIQPIYFIKTSTYKIRIDKISEGNYRYASWEINGHSKEPDLILKNGILEFQGSGGNRTFTFKDKNYTYEISVNIIGEDGSPDIYLTVYKNKRQILKQGGRIIRH